jgi:hypothetical protein
MLPGFGQLACEQRVRVAGKAADRAQRHMAHDAGDAEVFIVDQCAGELLVGCEIGANEACQSGAPHESSANTESRTQQLPGSALSLLHRWALLECASKSSIQYGGDRVVTKRSLLETIEFGSAVAEQEANRLGQYFVETYQWKKIAKGEVDIVFGKKGTGKSAIYSLIQGTNSSFFDNNILITAAENPHSMR